MRQNHQEVKYEVLAKLQAVALSHRREVFSRWYERKRVRAAQKDLEIKRQDLQKIREFIDRLRWCQEHHDAVKYRGKSVTEIDAAAIARKMAEEKLRVQQETPADLGWSDNSFPTGRLEEVKAMPDPLPKEEPYPMVPGTLDVPDIREINPLPPIKRGNYELVPFRKPKWSTNILRPKGRMKRKDRLEVYHSPRKKIRKEVPLDLNERMMTLPAEEKIRRRELLHERYMLARCKRNLNLDIKFKWVEEPGERTLLDMLNGVQPYTRSYWKPDIFSGMKLFTPENDGEKLWLEFQWLSFVTGELEEYLRKRKKKFFKKEDFFGMFWVFDGQVYRRDKTPRHVWREYFSLMNFLLGDETTKPVTTEEDEVQFSKYLHLDEVTVSEGTYEHERFDNDPYAPNPYRGSAWFSHAVSGKEELDMQLLPEADEEANEVLGYYESTIIGQRFFRESLKYYTGKEVNIPSFVKGGEEELVAKAMKFFKALSFSIKEIEGFGTDPRYEETVRRWSRMVTPASARQLLPVARREYQIFKNFPALGELFKKIGAILAEKAKVEGVRYGRMVTDENGVERPVYSDEVM